MAKLSTGARKALPDKDFAGPGRTYPVEDKSHAANAKARASEEANKGNLSKATEKKIDARADKVLGKNANRVADRVVARMSKSRPVR